MTKQTYIHGADPEEQARLGLMNDLINPACLRELVLREGDRVLDVGSGVGHFSRQMARAVGPSGSVVGIERHERQLEEAARLAAAEGESGLVDFRQGSAFDPPLVEEEWGTYDVVHTRFLLEHLHDPLAAVRVMLRAARPGGRIVLADDDHDLMRMWPDVPGFRALWSAYARLYDRNGSDPFVGRRLVALLHQAGAAPVRNTFVFYGGCAGSPHFEGIVMNLVHVLRGARDAIVEANLYEARAIDEILDAMASWSHRSDAALWYAINWAEGRRL
jgi:SAM-dependent methyltransferase